MTNPVTPLDARRLVLSARQGTFVHRWMVHACDGDWNLAAMIDQILYWHSEDRDGNSRATIERDGRFWIAKRHADWELELGINEGRAKRLLKRLRDTGMVDVKHWQFQGMRTAHYSPNYDEMLRQMQAVMDESGQYESVPTGRGESVPTGQGEIVPTGEGASAPTGRGDSAPTILNRFKDYSKDYKQRENNTPPAPQGGQVGERDGKRLKWDPLLEDIASSLGIPAADIRNTNTGGPKAAWARIMATVGAHAKDDLETARSLWADFAATDFKGRTPKTIQVEFGRWMKTRRRGAKPAPAPNREETYEELEQHFLGGLAELTS